MEETRDLYARFIGAGNREEIAFTHSTSEGMNIIAHMLSDKGAVISNELILICPGSIEIRIMLNS